MSIVLYGANGYTGRLITEHANNSNVELHLAGRNAKAIAELANTYNYKFTITDLKDPKGLDSLLSNASAVLHAAGPFTETAKPMIEACLRTNTHYCDITGEIWAFEEVMSFHEQAKAKGISLVPGVGFDVVPTDCLSAILHEKLPDADFLELAFTGDKTAMSRGTAVTMLKNVGKGGFIRENGALKNVPLAYEVKEFEFAFGKKLAMTIPWGDLMTAYHQTKIPSIKVFNGAGKKLIKSIKRYRWLKALLNIGFIQTFFRKKVEEKVTGPSEEVRNNGKTYIKGYIGNKKGQRICMEMITEEAYHLTAQTALEAARQLQNGINKNGYLTPAQAFGKDFIFNFEVELKDCT